jgi:hypothetical protein
MFKFTICDLVLVTTITALCVGWAGDRHEKALRIQRLETELANQRVIIRPYPSEPFPVAGGEM